MSAHSTEDDAQPAFRPLESITILAVVGILGLALGLIALVRPATTSASHKLAYTQSGSFSYSASASSTSVYGAKGLTTGQPIITKLVGPVQTRFDYRLSSDEPTNLQGTAALNLKVDLGSGFSRTFTVVAPKSFAGDNARVTGVLPLAAIQSFVRAASKGLGANASDGTVTITLQPRIKVSGALGTHALKATTYAPTLPFALNGTTLTVNNSDGAATTPDAPTTNPLRPSESGSISYQASEANTVPLLVAHPSVTAARAIGFAVALICLLLCLWLARPLRAGRSPGDRDRIRSLYGSQLVPVAKLAIPDGPVADVASMESLADLAKRYESMIMHVREDEADLYLVWDNGMLYRYRAALSEQSASAEAEPSEDPDPDLDMMAEWAEQLSAADGHDAPDLLHGHPTPR